LRDTAPALSIVNPVFAFIVVAQCGTAAPMRSLPGTNSPAVKRCSCNAQPSIYMLALTEARIASGT